MGRKKRIGLALDKPMLSLSFISTMSRDINFAFFKF